MLQKVSPPSIFELAMNGLPVENKVIIEASALNTKDDAVYLGHGLEEDYIGSDVEGKVVVVRGGSKELK